jgi:hypothetical protein
MKLALRILVTALVAGLLAVPAASAKPGGGKGHGKGAEKAKAAHEHKAGKEKKAKKDKSAKQAGKSEEARKHGKKEDCVDVASAAAAAVGSLFGSDASSACESAEARESEEQAVQALEPPNLEGLGPGQYCHQLEAWMATSGGDFSQTFGTEGSGFANDHGKCASRRAHGEDLLAVATAALPEDQAAEDEEQQELELPNLEGLRPGQYCHQLEAWMATSGGDFSQTLGTEGSGFANDHGKCASRHAHGEDLAPAALQSVCDAVKAAGGELPEACKPAEEQQAQQTAPAAAELTTVLRLFSF